MHIQCRLIYWNGAPDIGTEDSRKFVSIRREELDWTDAYGDGHHRRLDWTLDVYIDCRIPSEYAVSF